MAAWDRCADATLTLDAFQGQRCWIAEDLASKVDVAAKVRVFEMEGVVYLLTGPNSFFVPERAVKQSPNAQYEGWARTGLLTVSPGEIIDFDLIEDALKADAQRFEVAAVGYDPHQATQHATRMIAEGFPMIEVRQTVLSLSEAMKEFEALVLSGRFRHDGNPVMKWMVSNVVAHYDVKENIYPRKAKMEKKIDGAVAVIMALALRAKEVAGYAEGALIAL